ncbi:transcription elongation regulator 1 [Neltuma alba]|uniref:transcription elongation regulator 1 n=1 Tax=Neltuma alba TaxID=207710 RepID=UPI0010A328ED|nr:transcription elongation regulator 1 [Prosopis alba]
MDSFQQPHGYMRPQPPPLHTPDPNHSQFHQHNQIQPPRQPAPPQGPWFSNQFQYHPSQTPSPPPQWAPPPPPPPPPPHPDHFPLTGSYIPHSNTYPPPPSYHLGQFAPPPPPARSHVSPQFPPYTHIPQHYPQEWSTPNWPPNQSWDYPAHKNEEDWAARARAWADAKAAMESQHQHSQSQFSPAGRSQEQSHYHDQYQQPVDSRYPDIQNHSHPSSGYPQFSSSDASMQRRLPGHQEEHASVSSEAPYASDGHLSYNSRDGTTTGDPTVAFQHQGNLPTNTSVHQQEVPSSYSSVAGNGTDHQSQQSYTSMHLSSLSSQEQHHVQPSVQAPFASGSHSVDPAISLADQPLDFTPRFNRDGDLQMQSTYGHHDPATSIRGVDPVSGVPSINNWAPPVAPGVVYPPISPVLASGPQHDPSITAPPVPGHVAPPFGRFPGSGLPPPIPPGAAPFALSAGTTIHPTSAFSVDAYGVSGVPERPKKASVPNWLREEIKKAVIATPSAEHPKEESKFMNDGVDKSYTKGDEQDSKSIDSSKSAEEEEEDEEDDVEAVRTAAINQEIKRVLTEVLLKVTDELFDEIATKVLREDDLTSEVASNHKASASPPSVPVHKASAKVLVPVKVKEPEHDADNEKSNSSSPGDVLGLGNYASDAEDEDNEMDSSSVLPLKDGHQAGIKNSLKDVHDVPTNSSSLLKLDENGRSQTNLAINLGKTSNGVAIAELHDEKVTKKLDHLRASKNVPEDRKNELNAFERKHDRTNGKATGAEKATEDPQVRENRKRMEKADGHGQNSSVDFAKDVQSSKAKVDEKVNEDHRRKDERHQKREKADGSNEVKERRKDDSARHGEKTRDSESRKKSSVADAKGDNKEAEKSRRGSSMEETSRRKEHSRDKGEHKSRHKESSKSDRHKRKRSSSVSSRGRSSRDQAVNRTSESSDEGSDGSKRKPHARKRDLSPSPVRSRRRQVSRSPHSKHSQRRHSPYSSLDTSRGRRSRSRSPGRRHR